jgi:hypothetical protein
MRHRPTPADDELAQVRKQTRTVSSQCTNHQVCQVRLAVCGSDAGALPTLIHQFLDLASLLAQNKTDASTGAVLPKTFERVCGVCVSGQAIEVTLEPAQGTGILPGVVFEVCSTRESLDAWCEGRVCLYRQQRFLQMINRLGWCPTSCGDNVTRLVEVWAK